MHSRPWAVSVKSEILKFLKRNSNDGLSLHVMVAIEQQQQQQQQQTTTKTKTKTKTKTTNNKQQTTNNKRQKNKKTRRVIQWFLLRFTVLCSDVNTMTSKLVTHSRFKALGKRKQLTHS